MDKKEVERKDKRGQCRRNMTKVHYIRVKMS
jgi:hypothetical protein